ncbi:23S rRNA (cytidine1920-2'-O)/16S rRNA (cytidine1409-2'-O)-methyltransferase [Roseibium hamelinense]|uniref:23S rRNA (Cytidine1920-2'-O)/16S rRNA (Cytidine1409-2'-O)-methyltransferase n=1 Tax=Roseibium hamelinense TaxID=150831 RepID=A0A562STK8_9HYPH|nr:TlyA family RNA methyltransferase [Roseibium hamelinense]MTI42697.1 TlyA family RNA methyltransferase [Roseibium hamelinense]TWI84575.1 23S rRNA (cytidine1920-2'-O)/16S rRNA (cytidine1409-2'-O)-methyltransferase [Roseibium hamelinense]
MTKQRLDQHLVDIGKFPSRSRARDAITRGTVTVNGRIVERPAHNVAEGATIEVSDPASRYVSRAALKLLAALDLFAMDPSEKICLDVGASTGGFTQVLLERGARKVHAIDVGHDQLHDTLKSDPRVVWRDGLNARDLTPADIAHDTPQIVVSDVSFISLKLALPPALALAAPGSEAALLVKPQFEAGRANIRKGGLVTPETALTTANTLRDWLGSMSGWQAGALEPSPIVGGDGNLEWLLYGRKTGS